jgi:hypothetical protein
MIKLVVSIVLSIISFGGQTTGSQQVGGSNEPTRLELLAEKSTYYVGEPVEFIARLYNDRDKLIRWYTPSVALDVWIYHRKAGGEFIRYFTRQMQNMSLAEVAVAAPTEIPAHGVLELNLSVFYNTYDKQLVLPEAGEYEFKATVGGPRPNLESKLVRIRAVEPPAAEQAALAMLRDPALASFIEGDLRPELAEVNEVEAGAEKAVAFLQEHSRSMYAQRVKEQLKVVVEELTWEGGLTPKAKEIRALLREQR